MQEFIVFFLGFEGVNCLIRIFLLATGTVVQHGPKQIAIDLVISLAVMGWGLCLLVGGTR